ncbi:phospholipase A and acyltransferase 2-like isoform X2 [Mastacembelus armatus]|uniref:phospholipase A and acyltransferase 2-like isoform X2 n=1 Tax=Mastacembelus armatus TaxID=205130 RepID=UPI000E45AB26|nr:phospholipase A and acyltransferase 2-like isoform X2 [Mastacembelus armatus]
MNYQQQVDEIVSSGKFGDLIEFSYPIGYSHWGVYDGDGNVVHFAVTDQGQLLSSVRNSLQQMFPVCGDLLLGETRIRRVPLRDVNIPKGAHVFISNNRHAFTPSASQEMKLRCNALIGHEFPYHLFNFNCEHFATFVRYGKAVCNQIPLRRKNVECLEATTTFSNIVSSKEAAQDDSATTTTFSNILSSKEAQDDSATTTTFSNIVSSKEAAQDDSTTTTFSNIVSSKEAAQDDST